MEEQQHEQEQEQG